jgi:hypothetical protein
MNFKINKQNSLWQVSRQSATRNEEFSYTRIHQYEK